MMTTKEDVLRLAEAAGLDLRMSPDREFIRAHRQDGGWINVTDLISAVRAEAYEDAAKLCMKRAHRLGILRTGNPQEFYDMAEAIRNLASTIELLESRKCT